MSGIDLQTYIVEEERVGCFDCCVQICTCMWLLSLLFFFFFFFFFFCCPFFVVCFCFLPLCGLACLALSLSCSDLQTYEPRYEISNNVVCAASKGSD